MRPLKYKIELNESEKEELEKIIRKQTTAQNIAKRARIILMANTGIQALERISDELPMSKGKPAAREFEYERHGTQTVIAGFNVTTGIVHAVCGDTRKEDDFASFIEKTIHNNPDYKKYHFVLDQLNTHKSETLVCLIAELMGDEQDLGVKGASGILKSMTTRETYLMNAEGD